MILHKIYYNIFYCFFNLLGKWTFFHIYWCKSASNEIKRLFQLKEKVISQVLSVENISKSYYDLSFLKLLTLSKYDIQKLDFIYVNLLNSKDKMALLRDFVYKSDREIFKKFSHSMDKESILDYFVEFEK